MERFLHEAIIKYLNDGALDTSVLKKSEERENFKKVFLSLKVENGVLMYKKKRVLASCKARTSGQSPIQSSREEMEGRRARCRKEALLGGTASHRCLVWSRVGVSSSFRRHEGAGRRVSGIAFSLHVKYDNNETSALVFFSSVTKYFLLYEAKNT